MLFIFSAPDFFFQAAPAPGFFSSGSGSGSKEPKTPGSGSPALPRIVIFHAVGTYLSLLLVGGFVGLPLEEVRGDLLVPRSPTDPLQVVVDDVLLLEDNVLAAPVLDHPEELQRGDDVVGLDP